MCIRDRLYPAETLLDEEILRAIGESGVPEIVVRGTTGGFESTISNALTTETVSLGAPEERVRLALKASMIREMLGNCLLYTSRCV